MTYKNAIGPPFYYKPQMYVWKCEITMSGLQRTGSYSGLYLLVPSLYPLIFGLLFPISFNRWLLPHAFSLPRDGQKFFCPSHQWAQFLQFLPSWDPPTLCGLGVRLEVGKRVGKSECSQSRERGGTRGCSIWWWIVVFPVPLITASIHRAGITSLQIHQNPYPWSWET